jgi:diacylglycerol O-acyltransferase / wax synthase
MKQLTPVDSFFVFNEQRNAPLHIGPIMIYDPSTAEGGFVRFKDILNTFETRLYRSPVFRRKLVRVPFDIDNPYWIEDEDFDLEFHVRHLGLPKPGDWRQLNILLARLHSRPLDLSRPPWETYVIEGLDNIEGLPPGCFAMYMKIHHCAIDGATGNQIIEALHDLMPNPKPIVKKDDWKPESSPSQVALLKQSYTGLLKQPRRIVKLVQNTAKSMLLPNRITHKKEMEDHHIKVITRFNHKITSHRVFGAIPFKLERFKAIKNSVDQCTLNDVVLTVVSGALRKYLEQKGELPTEPLIAGVPISTRDEDNTNADGGNSVSGMRVSLCTDIADPILRFKAINADARATKSYANAIGARRLVDIAESIPSSVAALGMRIAAATGITASNPISHVIVTNVPGPQVPIFMCGARGVLWLGAGCPLDGTGLFHTINSYCGYIVVAYVCDRYMMTDPEFYDQCIRDSFEELEQGIKALTSDKTLLEPKPKAAARKKAPAKKTATKSASKNKVLTDETAAQIKTH